MKDTFIEAMSRLSTMPLEWHESFLALGTAVDLPSGTIVSRPNEPTQFAYFLYEGVIRDYYLDDNQNQHIIKLSAGPDIYVPSMPDFIQRQPATLFSETITEISGMKWHYNDLISFSNERSAVYMLFIKRALISISKKEEREFSLINQSASERYEAFVSKHPNLLNQVPLKYIASYLNISPETVSRIRAALPKRPSN